MFSRFSVFLAVPLLFGCAYMLETTIHDLEIVTPGAKNSICYAHVDGFRYRFHPPESISIRKTKEDIVVDCIAPGNRRKSVTISPQITDTILANISNGMVPGGAWDIASGAAFKFPGVLEIDFRGIPTTPEALPTHNNPDIRQPEDYDLEEFLPGDPRLNSDRSAGAVMPLQKRNRGNNNAAFGSNYVGTGSGSGKSRLPSSVATPSNRGASQPSANDAPAPLYPGE